MPNGAISESERGYLSAESKRRFTIIAGVLGALFFLAQFLLPMVIMFLVMMPATFMRDMKSFDLDGAALIGDDLWAVERTVKLDLKSSGSPTTTLALTRIRVADLSEAGPAIPLEGVARVSRTSKRPGSFPFGPNMMVLMMIPQLLPILLSLILAFLLTIQMRRYRVPDYALGAERRRFASLWQRAVAQLVDLIPFVAGFAFPMVWMWRMFSDPESLLENGPGFPFKMFGLIIGAFLWMLIVFLAYSYLEGRYGKTPGKWLVGIRVLGTDLQPCGFGRAFLRNLLTLVDGFFSFMVGALLVALTENWQRLGDMAARTIVVVDQKPA